MAQIITEEVSRAPQPAKTVRRRLHKIIRAKKTLRIFLGIIFVALIGTSIYYYLQYKKTKADPNAVAQQEVQTVTAQVAKIMELPRGEDPIIATVNDKDKLNGQQFFKNAENGDKILVYAGAKEAILYRPSANKIINVAPLVMDQNGGSNQGAQNGAPPVSQNSPVNNQTAQANTPPLPPVQNSAPLPVAETPSNPLPEAKNSAGATATNNDAQSSPINVVINNGSKTVGLVRDTQNKLSGISGINVISTGDAKKHNYTGTIVVDLTQKNTALVNQIAQAVGGQVGSLPAGETKPDNTDVLIIAGK